VLALTATACQPTETKRLGELVIAIETDMAIPDQIQEIQLYVAVRGEELLNQPVNERIPATLTLGAGPDPTTPVTIRVQGMRYGVARTLRQVTTTVPSDRSAVLRMPVQWLCDGTAEPREGAGGTPQFESECGAGMTCRAGRCVTEDTESDELLDYRAEEVFGGAAAPAPEEEDEPTLGACFDTVACLATGNVVAPQDLGEDGCFLDDFPRDENVNIGLRVSNDGICDSTGTTCFVPLDSDRDEGWVLEGDRVSLPPRVCSRLKEGVIAGVVASTACPTKTSAIPPCGEWSSVAPAPPAAGGAPGVEPLETTIPTTLTTLREGAEGEVCCPLLAFEEQLYSCVCETDSSPRFVSIDVESGQVTRLASFASAERSGEFRIALSGDSLYWFGEVGESGTEGGRPLYATNITSRTTSPTPIVTVDADVVENVPLLASGHQLYALADNVAGLPANASPLQLLRIALDTGTVVPLDTGSTLRVPQQLTQDPHSVYVISDTDDGTERSSRIVQFSKANDAKKVFPERKVTLANPDDPHGGYIGVTSNGTSLFALFEDTANDDGTIPTSVIRIDPAAENAEVIYETVVDTRVVSSLRMLGAAPGVVVLEREVKNADESTRDSTLLLVPESGGLPDIAASWSGDSAIFELATPDDTDDVFWLNQSGLLFRLPVAALEQL